MAVVWSRTATNIQSIKSQRNPQNTSTGQEAGQRADPSGGQGHPVTSEGQGQMVRYAKWKATEPITEI